MLKKISLLFIVIIFLTNCSKKQENLKQEHLFHIPVGIMEDEVNLFEKYGAITLDKLYYSMYNGVFYVVNTPSNKVMRFSSHGDVLSLIYNPKTYPGIISNDEQKRITSYPFSNPTSIAIDSTGNFYVQDNAFAEKQFSTTPGQPFFDNVIIKFNDKGEKLYTLGQEGINSSNFPLIHRITTTKNNDIVVIARLFDSWKIYWFDSEGLLKTAPEVIENSQLSKNNSIYIDDIFVDMNEIKVYISTDILTKESNNKQITLFSKELGANKEFKPVLEKRPGNNENITSLIGIDNKSNLYYLSSSGNNRKYYYTLYIVNNEGKITAENRLETPFSPSQIIPKFYFSTQNVITAFLIHSSGVEVVWWRIKKSNATGIINYEQPIKHQVSTSTKPAQKETKP